jgi:hypothetical protein
MDRRESTEAGKLAALTDWRGGYRAEATRDAAEGVVRALVGRDPTSVEHATDAYLTEFRELLLHGGPVRPPRVRYKRTPYPW